MGNGTGRNTKQNARKEPLNILVVGDWFVDEHWVTGIHRSSSSSRTGQAHYRALHNLNSTVESFCGAGLTASLLYQVKEDNERLCSITGLGLWHEEDTDLLREMFDFDRLRGQTLFKLTRNEPKIPSGVKLCNIYPLLTKQEQEQVCTTRIIRIYHSSKGGDIRYNRIDWELPSVSFDKHKLENIGRLELPEKVDAVVIKDLGKGVVSEELIEILVAKYKEAKWFVSTKAWAPEWFAKLQEVDLRLLLIPQVAAQEAIREGKLSCWITRGGYIDSLAIGQIEEIIATVRNHHSLLLVILPRGFSAIAYAPTAGSIDKCDCVIQSEASLHPPMIPMGMASIFLPALITALLRKYDDINLKEIIEKSLRHTYKWVKSQGERILKPEEWDPTTNIFMSDEDQNIGNDIIHFGFKNILLSQEKEMWKESMKNVGVINNDRFELWRSMVEVDSYVCCVQEKRRELSKLIRGVEKYFSGEMNHHVGCMLIAAPGSGKTHLVRRLAESFNIKFLPFNITQMCDKSDIIKSFDTVITTQSQNRNIPILVFVDEINGKLNGEHVYDAFLAPLEDGIYIRDGMTFHIDPCLWIFSGTEDPRYLNDPDLVSEKGSDFISRLTMGLMNIKETDGGDYQQIENVYLGVSLLRREFPDIRFITNKVFWAFQMMPVTIRARQLRHFIKSFKDIQYGVVSSKNVPKDMFREINMQGYDSWDSTEEGDKIEIIDTYSTGFNSRLHAKLAQ